MRRPLVGVALCFAAGIALGMAGVRQNWALAPWVASSLLSPLLWRAGRWRLSRGMVLAAVLCAGAFAAASAVKHDRALGILLNALPSGNVVVEGVVGGAPEWWATGRGNLRVRAELLDVTLLDDKRHLSLNKLGLRWYGPDTSRDEDLGAGVVPMPGERWRFEGRMRTARLRTPRRVSDGWWVVASVDSSERLSTTPPYNPRMLRFRLREALAARITEGIENCPDSRAVLRAMLLGDRGGMTRGLSAPFRDSGTFHVFAISGLHVGILGLLGAGALGMLGVSRRYWFVALGPFLLAYVWLAGARPSAIRAATMLCLYLAGPALGRRPDGLSALAGAALLMLAHDPLSLTDAGFVLTFGVVTGLLIVTPALRTLIERWTSSEWDGLDRRAAEISPAAGDKRRRLSFAFFSRLRDLAAVSLAAWLSSAPLMAHFFGRFIWVGLPANMLMTPLAFLVPVAGVLSVLGGFLDRGLGVTFNHANRLLIAAMRRLAATAAALPAARIEARSISLWMALGMLLLLLRLAVAIPRKTIDRQQLEWDNP